MASILKEDLTSHNANVTSDGLSVKTQFLRHGLSNFRRFKQSSTFLDVVLSIYRFKKDCFPFKDGIKRS